MPPIRIRFAAARDAYRMLAEVRRLYDARTWGGSATVDEQATGTWVTMAGQAWRLPGMSNLVTRYGGVPEAAVV